MVDSLPVLATKLYPPPITPDLEVRTELLERLEGNPHRPLTLISAPAGYGKSTLVSMWLERSDRASAWISLDEGDNDLLTFLTYVVAAVLGAFPDAQLNTHYLLNTTSLSPQVDVARYLLNDLDQIGEPFILVLDDVHLVHEQGVHDLLAALLRHPLPTFQLVLVTRNDPPLPLASLRAHGQVTEIRARDLRFTVSETGRLLAKRLQREVDDITAEEWTAKTEGWVTAIHLAALALRYRNVEDDRAEFEGSGVWLQEYLTAEVISNLPQDIQEWLLSASLLDRFCATLCEAVLGKEFSGSDSEMTGEEFIRWLQDGNLFVVPVDSKRVWFRFHHLFQEMLRDALRKRFDAETIAAYHRRASRWFVENNLFDEAIRHAIAGEDIDAAIRIVVDHRYDLMNTEQWHRLDSWLKMLPAEVIDQSPFLESARCVLIFYEGRDKEFYASSRVVHDLLNEVSLEKAERRVILGESSVLRGLTFAYQMNAEELVTQGRLASDMLPEGAFHYRSLAIGIQLLGEQMNQNIDHGQKLVDSALSSPGMPEVSRARLMFMRSLVCFLDGDIESALRSSAQALMIGEQHHYPELVSQSMYYLGACRYLRDELEQTILMLESLMEHWALSAPSYVAYGAFVLALSYLAKGRNEDAELVLEQVTDHYPLSAGTAASRIAQACQIELQIRMGNIEQARRMSAGFDFDFRLPIWFIWAHQLTPIKLLLAEGTASSLASARDSLETLDAQMQSIHRNSVRIDALALLSITCEAQGDNATSSSKLVEALTLGERGGYIRNFVDLGPPMEGLLTRLRDELGEAQQSLRPYIDRILAAFPTPGPDGSHPRSPSAGRQATSTVPELIESLTERELQVLRLLATELTPAEIADQLVVSVDTVRTHTKNLYFKLDVHSRPEAVHRGIELSLISSP